jgi:hypothetical protein
VRSVAAGEDEGAALLQAVVLKELQPATAEVALPLTVVEYFDGVGWLDAAALHDGMRQYVPSHRVDELEG